ncbi:MAG: AsmA family protein [Candidatus Binatia bacterium]
MIKAHARKISRIGIVLIIVFALSALILFNLNKIIAYNKDYFLAQAGQTLGRKLSAERVRIRLWNGIELRIEGFTMSDDPAFSPETFLRAAELQVNLKFLPLLKRELRIERLTLHDPEIAIIRDEKGVFNFSTIRVADEREYESVQRRLEEPTLISAIARSPLALVSLLQINEGKLRFADKKDHVDLPLNHVNFNCKEFMPGQPFLVELSAALLTDRPNLKLQAYVGPLGARMHLLDIPVDLQLTIDALDTDKLKAAVPRIKSYLPKVFALSGLLSIKALRIKGTLRELNLDPSSGSSNHTKRG